MHPDQAVPVDTGACAMAGTAMRIAFYPPGLPPVPPGRAGADPSFLGADGPGCPAQRQTLTPAQAQAVLDVLRDDKKRAEFTAICWTI